MNLIKFVSFSIIFQSLRENINIPENETGSPNCHRECLELKERTSRLRIKKGISQKDLEHVIQNKASKEKMNEVFQQAIDSYLQVQASNFSFFHLVLKNAIRESEMLQ